MIRQIAPQFFTTDIRGTVAYYEDKLGFQCLGTWQDPPVYAVVARDQHPIHFRCATPPPKNMRTNWSTHNSTSKMQTRFISSTPPTASSSHGDLPTCRGARQSL
jgi:hypothetical protein